MTESIISLIGIFFIPATVIVLIVYFRTKITQRQLELQANLYEKAIEKGIDLPKDMFAAIRYRNPKRSLNTGIVFIAVGLGMVIFALFMWVGVKVIPVAISSVYAILGLAAIPMMIGVGFLVIYYLGKKQGEDSK